MAAFETEFGSMLDGSGKLGEASLKNILDRVEYGKRLLSDPGGEGRDFFADVLLVPNGPGEQSAAKQKTSVAVGLEPPKRSHSVCLEAGLSNEELEVFFNGIVDFETANWLGCNFSERIKQSNFTNSAEIDCLFEDYWKALKEFLILPTLRALSAAGPKPKIVVAGRAALLPSLQPSFAYVLKAEKLDASVELLSDILAPEAGSVAARHSDMKTLVARGAVHWVRENSKETRTEGLPGNRSISATYALVTGKLGKQGFLEISQIYDIPLISSDPQQISVPAGEGLFLMQRPPGMGIDAIRPWFPADDNGSSGPTLKEKLAAERRTLITEMRDRCLRPMRILGDGNSDDDGVSNASGAAQSGSNGTTGPFQTAPVLYERMIPLNQVEEFRLASEGAKVAVRAEFDATGVRLKLSQPALNGAGGDGEIIGTYVLASPFVI